MEPLTRFIRAKGIAVFKGRSHLFRDKDGNWAVPVSPAFGRWIRG